MRKKNKSQKPKAEEPRAFGKGLRMLDIIALAIAVITLIVAYTH